MRCRWNSVPLLFLAVVPACYTFQPLAGSTPPANVFVVADLTDRGTADLGPSIGPGVGRIEGRLVSSDSAQLAIAVDRMELNRGGSTKWAGETVTVPRQYVANVRERTLSRSRTAIVTGAVVAAVVGIFAAINLVVGPQDDSKTGGGTQPGT